MKQIGSLQITPSGTWIDDELVEPIIILVQLPDNRLIDIHKLIEAYEQLERK